MAGRRLLAEDVSAIERAVAEALGRKAAAAGFDDQAHYHLARTPPDAVAASGATEDADDA